MLSSIRPRRLAVVALLLVQACTAYTPALLEPNPSPLSSRLLPLHLGLAETDVLREEGVRGVTVQTDFATVFRRDLEANVFMHDDRRWGYTELRITYDDDAITGGGAVLAGLSIVTLFIPTVLGVPVTRRQRTIQAEIVIYNSRRVEVAKELISGKVEYSEGLYRRDESRRAGIEAVKVIMEQFRSRLASDVEAVNAKLREAGPVR